MNEYALILYHRQGTSINVVLFPDRAAVDRYIVTRPDVLEETWLWQVARIELQSQAVGAAGIELLADRARA